MSIRKRGRRKIVCDHKNYIWYLALDYDSPYYILKVISEDKDLIIAPIFISELVFGAAKGSDAIPIEWDEKAPYANSTPFAQGAFFRF